MSLTDIDVSICIVTLQAREYLRNCLNSLKDDCSAYSREIIVVDNHSDDGTIEMLRQDFQSVLVIQNEGNAGFVRPMNQAIRAARGRFFLMLNPDTLAPPQAVDTLVKFLQEHGEAGVCGPKVLNADGTFQKPCRRGDPTPLAVISYFTGLDKLFPHQEIFGGYLLGYLDEDQVYPVGGVSGSCMLIRRKVIEKIGYLDERFFAYQEDADFCYRARAAGWKVYYVPTASITHYGGRGGSRVDPMRSIVAWHRSYLEYYRKNLASRYFFLFNGLYYGLIYLKLGFSLGINALRKEKYAGPKR